jgi:hypothetical protein
LKKYTFAEIIKNLKHINMNNSRGKAWTMFGIAAILCIASLFFCPQWVWVPLPFVCTGLAQAFDAI